MKKPRDKFAKPVVSTTDDSCPRCCSLSVHKSTFPPPGASYNPPAALWQPGELARCHEFRCRICGWCWYPDHPAAKGHYAGRAHARAGHDPGDEDRS